MASSADLLNELRIDRKALPPPSRRGLWIGLAIGAKAVNVDFAMLARLGVLVGIAPRILRHFFEVTTRLPVIRAIRRTLDQCLQDLVKRGLITRVSAREYAKDKRLFE